MHAVGFADVCRILLCCLLLSQGPDIGGHPSWNLRAKSPRWGVGVHEAATESKIACDAVSMQGVS